jgi:hypothetical protein
MGEELGAVVRITVASIHEALHRRGTRVAVLAEREIQSKSGSKLLAAIVE